MGCEVDKVRWSFKRVRSLTVSLDYCSTGKVPPEVRRVARKMLTAIAVYADVLSGTYTKQGHGSGRVPMFSVKVRVKRHRRKKPKVQEKPEGKKG